MKFAKEDMISILDDSAPDGFEIVDRGGWVSEGKFDFCTVVFKHNERFYQVRDSRWGSYYSDYTYASTDWDDFIEPEEVRPVRKVITTWEVVQPESQVVTRDNVEVIGKVFELSGGVEK